MVIGTFTYCKEGTENVFNFYLETDPMPRKAFIFSFAAFLCLTSIEVLLRHFDILLFFIFLSFQFLKMLSLFINIA